MKGYAKLVPAIILIAFLLVLAGIPDVRVFFSKKRDITPAPADQIFAEATESISVQDGVPTKIELRDIFDIVPDKKDIVLEVLDDDLSSVGDMAVFEDLATEIIYTGIEIPAYHDLPALKILLHAGIQKNSLEDSWKKLQKTGKKFRKLSRRYAELSDARKDKKYQQILLKAFKKTEDFIKEYKSAYPEFMYALSEDGIIRRYVDLNKENFLNLHNDELYSLAGTNKNLYEYLNRPGKKVSDFYLPVLRQFPVTYTAESESLVLECEPSGLGKVFLLPIGVKTENGIDWVKTYQIDCLKKA